MSNNNNSNYVNHHACLGELEQFDVGSRNHSGKHPATIGGWQFVPSEKESTTHGSGSPGCFGHPDGECYHSPKEDIDSSGKNRV